MESIPIKKFKKPVLIYDGDCEFCRLWIARCSSLTKDEVDYCSSQDVGKDYPEISLELFKSSVYFVDSEGDFCSGAQAVFKTVAFIPGGNLFLLAYKRVPGFASISEWSYRQVAKNRKIFSILTP
jgi:predicted DCC family thiol-disulfide oxidoreductase YuxK